MKTVTFPNGTTVPALGMGTWNMGDSDSRRADEIKSIHAGLEAGIRVVDTAEMYGSGRSEKLVGEAIRGRRDDVFLVSKVLPSNASRKGVRRACEASLKRLGTEYLDLYLLHWEGSEPLEETIAGFDDLVAADLIGSWGVSNFDTDGMREVESITATTPCAANQVLYSLDYRGAEFDLLARDRAAGIVTMAYSPLGQGGDLLRAPVLKQVAARHKTSLGPASPAQIALAWVLRQENVLAIPKAGSPKHQHENFAATEITLTRDDLAEIDAAIAPPRRKEPLAMI
ncbi:oxidoreductase [Komagataeibacter nataicola]|uniref:Oxidoreductase n=1 Tax=Komagataeibacter nataicola TaxID=265960 RepID=A0A9N7CC21_9PROT|nr:aldo/keto reductase [Komagataeibacter nataicola]AQU86874.1 oxidoreductase [Komagataeibacter nataicola]PYD67891.1 oxidoreductase [Komagataeibacter nataicola]WEQ56172.1 aldo/keto reductase [Komagataeibacter nataicola]GBR24106.1 aldo/keto reductase [Komagataeibacter nataicola NRIC 0616]